MECSRLSLLNLHSTIGIHRFPLLSSTSFTTITDRRRRPWSCLLRPITSPNTTFSFRFCANAPSTSGSTGDDSGDAFGGRRAARLLNVVLVSPQIAGNTGCIARTCAASAVNLHLVEPLGYTIDDAKLKRAGLDYWPYVMVKIHSSWKDFREYFCKQDGEKRLLAFTKRGTVIHSDFTYKPGDWLVFGSETSGLPPDALLDCSSKDLGAGTIRIPMIDTYVRCLNLSVSVGIALYEASRQLNYEQMMDHDNLLSGDNCRLFISEDIYA